MGQLLRHIDSQMHGEIDRQQCRQIDDGLAEQMKKGQHYKGIDKMGETKSKNSTNFTSKLKTIRINKMVSFGL